ncbi:MAG: class I SAM-dependent methyltransferase [Oligoflexia bacterium]|nr:class I SAM-dependent methyltransferase [Oligoflexia bacterium]
MSETNTALTNQWNDFLLRQVDPYATAKYEILLDWLGNIAGRSALVVGSGSGELAALMAGKGAKVTAIDISEEYVELTRKTAQRFQVPMETAVAKLEDFHPGKKYDIVAATDVIEHIEDDQAAVQQLKELLSEEGTLVITVPALPALFGYHDEVLGHFRRYTASSLRALISGGFEISRLRYYGLFLIPVALLISRILRRPYPVKAAGNQKSALGAIIRSVFSWEKIMSPPLGTSLLLTARPRR